MIEIKALTKEYFVDKGDSFQALKGIDLSFPKVQFVSILGPSGCGKTTLLNIIGGLDSFSSGEVLFKKRSLKELTANEIDSYRNHEIGFVFQNYFMIPTLNILDNVKMSLTLSGVNENEATKKAKEALEKVGLSNSLKKKPNQLSGGQQQRAAIARAIVSDPSILLCDEPTGALDSKTSIEVMELLKEISKNKLVIMVTHNEILAEKYSDRIIRMKDGKVESDSLAGTPYEAETASSFTKTRLSFLTSLKLSLKNIWTKKWKSILTAVANSFGMIGIAFFMALNNGFSEYTTRLSEESASSMPVVVTAFSKNTKNIKDSLNVNVKFPDDQEVYPYVNPNSQTQVTYTYNNFSNKYFNYLDSLKESGLIKEYMMSYGDDYSFNLMTEYPDSISGTAKGTYDEVDTTVYSGNYYANQVNLPCNIFHVLYGNLDQYDLLCGSLPKDKNDLVLVVDDYNRVSFNILKQLGFYNQEDTQEDVLDSSNNNKVKGISFEDIVGNGEDKQGKEYKIFYNEDYYDESFTKTVLDGLNKERELQFYSKKKDSDPDFYHLGKSTTLHITGIIRAKSTSAFTMLSPALCYTKELQDEFTKENESSSLAKNIKNEVVFAEGRGLDDTSPSSAFVSEIQAIFDEYNKQHEESGLPLNSVNEVVDKYFTFYYPFSTNQDSLLRYTKSTYYFSDARTFGADLVPEEFYGVDLTDQETLMEYLNKFKVLVLSDIDEAYRYLVGMLAYMNAYSKVEEVVIFPKDLSKRQELLKKLDEFNESVKANEKVLYASENENEMIRDVGEVISIVSMILLIFACVSIIVSCSMTMLLTSNNVLERKKEIGLLRSLGARKKDIAVTFEFESFLIGFLAGIIGSLLTFVISFPINNMMNYYYPYYYVGNICHLTWYHVIIIIAVSILIGLISALIPSLKAASEKPADALKSE